MIPQTYIDELLSRLDIVTVIDARVKLKKTGKNWSACCPFHDEKTPSFSVSEQKQFYYCFGCGASGHALGFVLAFEGGEFPAVVEKLAESVGMQKWTSEQNTKRSTIPAARRRKLEEIMANERYLLKFTQASIKSGVKATEFDKKRARLAADRIRKITEILAK
jgi:DNA primase